MVGIRRKKRSILFCAVISLLYTIESLLWNDFDEILMLHGETSLG